MDAPENTSLSPERPGPRILLAQDEAALFDALVADGFEVHGPTVRDGAIVLDRLASFAALPSGWADEQGPGYYRLRRRADAARFGFAAPAHAWRRLFQPPEEVLFRVRADGGHLRFEEHHAPASQRALVGVRACDLAAIHIQDRVLRDGPFVDSHYAAARRGVFIVAVTCASAAGMCFCASMGSGPEVGAGFDLLLAELLDPPPHRYLVRAGSARGAALLARLPAQPAAPEDERAAADQVAHTRASMGRQLATGGLAEALTAALESPHWDDVGARCVGCASCTLACPTCFCTEVVEVTRPGVEGAARVRRADSCFTLPFSHLVGHSVRVSPGARYRHWLTHKLATWQAQFGTPGCVGCGRCITFCPVGIDLTAEASAVRAAASTVRRAAHASGAGLRTEATASPPGSEPR